MESDSDSDGQGVALLHIDSDEDEETPDNDTTNPDEGEISTEDEFRRSDDDNESSDSDPSLGVEQSYQHHHGGHRSESYYPGDDPDSSDGQDATERQGLPPLQDMNLLPNASSSSGGPAENVTINPHGRIKNQHCSKDVDKQQHSDVAKLSNVTAARKEETTGGNKHCTVSSKQKKTSSGAFGGLKKGFLSVRSPSKVSQFADKEEKSYSTGDSTPYIKKQESESTSLHLPVDENALKSNQTLMENKGPPPLQDMNMSPTASSRSGGPAENVTINPHGRTKHQHCSKNVDKQQHGDVVKLSNVTAARQEETTGGNKHCTVSSKQKKTSSGAFGGLKKGFLSVRSPSKVSQFADIDEKSYSTGDSTPLFRLKGAPLEDVNHITKSRSGGDRNDYRHCSEDQHRDVVEPSYMTAPRGEEADTSGTGPGIAKSKQKPTSGAFGSLDVEQSYQHHGGQRSVSHYPGDDPDSSDDQDATERQGPPSLQDMNMSLTASSRSGGPAENVTINPHGRTKDQHCSKNVDKQQHSDVVKLYNVTAARKETTGGNKHCTVSSKQKKTSSGAFGGLKKGFLFVRSPSKVSQFADKDEKLYSTGDSTPYIKKQESERNSLHLPVDENALKSNQTLVENKASSVDHQRSQEEHEATGSELQKYNQPLPGTSSGISTISGTVSTRMKKVTTHISDKEAKGLLQTVVSSEWDTNVDTDNRRVNVHFTQNIIKDSAVNMGGKTIINPAGKKQRKQPRQQTVPTSVQKLRPTQSVLDLIIQGKTWVTVTGSPGEGKTTAAYLTLKKLHGMGRQVYEIRTPDDYFKVKDSNGSVLMFNDILGSNQFSQDNFEKWRPIFTDIFDMKEHREFEHIGSLNRHFKLSTPKTTVCIILVCRSSVLNSATCHLGRFKGLVFESVVNLTHEKCSSSERYDIWKYHADMYNVSIDEKTVMDVCNMSLSHGFPHCCRLFASMYSGNVNFSMELFFSKPIEFLNQTIESLLDDSTTGSLLREMLKNDGCLQLDSITDDDRRYQCKTVVDRLKGAYLSEEGDSVRFHHASVYDSAAFVVCRKDPLFVIRHCSLSFQNERVRYQGLESKEESLLTITVDSKYIDTYIERLKTELADDNLSLVLSHSSFHDQGFVEKFMKFMKAIHSASQVVSESCFIKDFIHKKDKASQHSFLFHSTNSKSDKLLKYICNQIQLSQQELVDALFGICEHSSVSSLTYLLNWYVNIPLNVRNPKQLTPLLAASRKSSAEILKLLIENGADVTVREREGNSVLHNICVNGVDGDGDVVRVLIDKGVDVNWKSENYLLMAALCGNVNVVSILADEGADVNKTDKDNKGALFYACLGGFSHIISILYDKGADINMGDNHGIKPLHVACNAGYENIMTFLFNRGIDINQKDNEDHTALHWACIGGHVNVMTALLDRGFDINQKDNEGSTALHWACSGGHVNVMTALLDRGVDINQTEKNGFTVLHSASLEGHVNVMTALLDRGVDINQADKEGCTALHAACEEGHVNVMMVLLFRGADINQKDNEGGTALHWACSGGHVNVMTALLDRGVDINQADKEGRTAHHCACREGHVNVLTALLDRGVDINTKDIFGCTALHYACREGHVNVMTALLNRGVDINQIDKDGSTALHYSGGGGHVKIITALIDRDIDINQTNKDGSTVLHFACFSRNASVITALIDRGVGINKKDNEGSTAFHLACIEGHNHIIAALLDRGVDINQTDKVGCTALHYACGGGHVNVMIALLDRGVDINQTDKVGRTALHYACGGGHVNALTALLGRYVYINQKDDGTYIYSACLEGRVNIMTDLLDRGVDINQADKEGRIALHCACGEGHVNVLRALLDRGVDINQADKKGRTALHCACKIGHVNVMTTLLDRGVDINKTNKEGHTPLHFACSEGHVNVMTALLDRGVDINQTDWVGCTALHYACGGGHVNVMTALLDRGVNINKTHKDGSTVLHFACFKGHVNVMMALLDRGVDINQTHVNGFTALHYACLGGHVNSITALFDRGIGINKTDKDGCTALHYACSRKGHVTVATALLDIGVDINRADNRGRTALHLACGEGQINTMMALLEKGADINQTDNDDNTALHYSCEWGHVNVMTGLLDRGADINKTDKYGSTALRVACSAGHINIITALLDRGVQVNQRDMITLMLRKLCQR